MINILQWFAIVLSLLGNYLINKKNIFGFIVWIISNIIWIVGAIYANQPQQAVLFMSYIILCFHGLYQWGKNKNEA